MTTEQDKVRELQRALYRAAKADPGRRFHALYDKLLRRDVLERAWQDALQGLVGEAWRGAGRRWVVETDIADCFGSIPWDRLMAAVEERIVDRNLLKLLRAVLRAGVMEDGAVTRSVSGTAQGGP